MVDTARFKVLSSKPPATIPWSVIAPHEAQAQKNHYQSLRRLNERGGLSWSEMIAVLEDRKWHALDTAVAQREVEAFVAQNRPDSEEG